MADQPKRPDGSDAEGNEDPDRAAILARRSKFIAFALAGLAGVSPCDKLTTQPCLKKKGPDTDAQVGGNPDAGPANVKPDVCLKIKPHPCLKMKAPEKPHPCLLLYVPSPKEDK